MFLRSVACRLILIICLVSTGARAQEVYSDTLHLTIQQAEKQFIDSNFSVLAAHYNVDAQKALIDQAKLWQNPVLNTDQVIAANGRFFPYGVNPDGTYSGQYYIQVQQLILTARKRGKQIDLATTNARSSELQLQDLVRNLRYQLHQYYFNLQQQLSLMGIYKDQATQLDRLTSGMQAQLNAGNIAQKDFIRMQALVIALQQDMTDLNKSISDNESALKTLLQIKEPRIFVLPVLPAGNTGNTPPAPLEELLNTALQTNPAYLLQQEQVLYQQQNLSYQKALRSPDITLGPNFDRNSNFAPNYVGLGISLPLPVFNKNQGNIKAAEYNISQQQAALKNLETTLRNNVAGAYNKWLLTTRQNSSSQADFYDRYRNMYNNVLRSYQQRQISLLEFIDFFNEYTSSQQRLLQQQLNIQLAKEELLYQTGK